MPMSGMGGIDRNIQMTSDERTGTDEQTGTFIAERPVDVVSRLRAFVRSLHPLRVIAHKSLRGPYSQQEFIDATCGIQHQAATSSSVRDKSVALWQMEKLGFSYCRHGKNTLNDPAIPAEVQPISHVGLGIAATETALFAADKISELIEPRAHPDYRLFPYESIGCIWAVYANRWFRMVFQTVSKANIPRCNLPDWCEFIGHFSPDIQRLISHGYGRTIYFKDFNVGRAIRNADRLEAVDTLAAVQGIAFAYAMLNHADLHRVLEVGTDLKDPEIAQAFQNGLVYALAFWEWAFSGFLDDLTPRSARQVELVVSAQEIVAESHRSGALAVFGMGLERFENTNLR